MKNFIETRNKLIIAILAKTGVGVTELVNIKDQDVNLDKIYLMGKGRKERYLSISPALKRIMIRYERAKKEYLQDKMRHDNTYIINYKA